MTARALAVTLLALALALALAGTAAAGDVERRLTVDGRERSYLLHLPPTSGSGEPLPLVVVLHGGAGNAWAIRKQTGFCEEADWRGFAVAYPNGSHSAVASVMLLGQAKFLVWNGGSCCGWATEHAVDDVGFVRALVEDVARQLPIDRKRVFAAGISNGGMMSYRLACEASDVFAAVGVVSGALVSPGCAPRKPVSVIHIHGTADTYVPLRGGPGRFTPPGYEYPPTASAIAFWRAADGCDSAPSLSSPAAGVRLTRYQGCRGGAAVDYYELEGGGHSWPGGDRLSLILPPVSHAIAATPVLWEFFATHPKP